MDAFERITYRISIDTKKCNGCNNCTTACPVNAVIEEKDTPVESYEQRVIVIKNGVAMVLNPFRCDGCGVCIIVCPQNCITIDFIPLDEYEDVTNADQKV